MVILKSALGEKKEQIAKLLPETLAGLSNYDLIRIIYECNSFINEYDQAISITQSAIEALDPKDPTGAVWLGMLFSTKSPDEDTPMHQVKDAALDKLKRQIEHISLEDRDLTLTPLGDVSSVALSLRGFCGTRMETPTLYCLLNYESVQSQAAERLLEIATQSSQDVAGEIVTQLLASEHFSVQLLGAKHASTLLHDDGVDLLRPFLLNDPERLPDAVVATLVEGLGSRVDSKAAGLRADFEANEFEKLVALLDNLDEASDAVSQLRNDISFYGPQAEVAIGALTRILTNHHNSWTRSEAAICLREIGVPDEQAVSALCQIGLSDEEDIVRDSSAEALASIGRDSSEAVEALIETLHSDRRASVRGAAAMALGHTAVSNQSAVKSLCAAAKDSDEFVRDYVIIALGSIASDSRDAVKVLVRALLEDTESRVRECAARVLGKFSTLSDIATPPLVQALESDSCTEVQCTAAESLGRLISADAAVALVTALRNATTEVRMASAKALSHGEPCADIVVPALIDALGDESYTCARTEFGESYDYVSRHAADSLASIGRPAREYLSVAIESHSDASVRRAVQHIVDRLSG